MPALSRLRSERWTGPAAVAIALCLAIFASPALAEKPNAALIWKNQCVRCHGDKGQGTDHAEALSGENSIPQLAELIRKTMPEDKPGTLKPEEADALAEFVHDSFYSPIAQERNRAARIELARLTVRQYRQSVADLIGSFRNPWFSVGEERGIKGEYYKGRRIGRGEPALGRVDPQIAFDFGNDAPDEKLDPAEFSIRWNGSLLAPETGLYEFTVRTEHAGRLWINDNRTPLIDAWVKSGDDTEYRESIYLVGGRAYPLRLEYSKGKQGVNDDKKDKKLAESKTSITLLWRRPHREPEPIPQAHLSPKTGPEVFVCATNFPPDDRSYGWERGTTISRAWKESVADAAIETANYVVLRLNELAKTNDMAADRVEKLKEFSRHFVERAIRRPLSGEQRQILVDKQFEMASRPEVAVQRVVLLTLQSPWFLYREVQGSDDPHDVAARLAFGLWDSLPDEPLRKGAAEGRLTTREQIAREAERMLADPRAKAKLHDFLLTWLKADQPHDLAKSAEEFAAFDAAAISDLRTSLELSLDEVLSTGESDFRQLLLADETWLNGRLAKVYGVELPENAPFQKVKLDPGRRAGVLTHPYLMASFAHYNESSPIHRGVFLARGLLGISLRPPPEAVAPLSPDLHPSLTTRERVAMQTKAAVCMTCHGVINPLGFTLENFDAIGRFREAERDKPIDATGRYVARDGKAVEVQSARELAEFLATSPECHEAFVEQLFHHLVQQPVRAYGPETAEHLRSHFASTGFNIRRLVVEILAITAPVGRVKVVSTSSE